MCMYVSVYSWGAAGKYEGRELAQMLAHGKVKIYAQKC